MRGYQRDSRNRRPRVYLPYADGDYVRVYLYALFLSAHGDGADDLASLARRLGLDAATADAAVVVALQVHAVANYVDERLPLDIELFHERVVFVELARRHLSLDGYVTVENKFIIDYLPYADGDYVRVYLYALF